MSKPPISCFIRTCNEERTISAAVSAALTVADEVIVVDSGSTDATVAKAEAAGARVVKQPWLGWGRQKRVGEDHCRHDYVLDVDADEVVTPALAAEIRDLFANGTPPYSIYSVRIAAVPPGGEDWRRFSVVTRNRLYDRRVVRAPDHAAWDQFIPPAGVPIGHLKAELLHHTYRDFAHLVDKFNTRSSVQAQKGIPKLLRLRILFGLPLYFFRHLFLKGLIRGGVYGVVLAGIAAHGRWLRDAKVYERLVTRKKDNEGPAP
jgi:glycosyltransferase involved in cell wall biosynthesis